MDCTSCYATAQRRIMQTVAPEPPRQAAPPQLVYRPPRQQEWEVI
jgi:hypothetical protein